MSIFRVLLLSPLILTCSAKAADLTHSAPPVVAFEPMSGQAIHAGDLPRLLEIPRKDQDRQTCYSLRSYRFRRPDAASDATEMQSYSTCQTADLFRWKDAGGATEKIPRSGNLGPALFVPVLKAR